MDILPPVIDEATCSTGEAARELGLARGTVATMIRDGLIPGARADRGAYRIPRRALIDLVKRRATERQRFGKQPHAPAGRVGRNLHRVMEERGLSQAELGRLASVPQSRISLFVRNLASPRVEQLEKLAAALGVPVDVLVRNPDAPAAA